MAQNLSLSVRDRRSDVGGGQDATFHDHGDPIARSWQGNEPRGLDFETLCGGIGQFERDTQLRWTPKRLPPVSHACDVAPDDDEVPKLVASLLRPGQRDAFLVEEQIMTARGPLLARQRQIGIGGLHGAHLHNGISGGWSTGGADWIA